MRGWPLVFDSPSIRMPYWVKSEDISNLLETVRDNTGWGVEELDLLLSKTSNMLPFMHTISLEDEYKPSNSIGIKVGEEEFLVPVIDNYLAISEPVNCFAIPSKLSNKMYIVNAVFNEEYTAGISTSSGYFYLVPEAENGIYITDGLTPFTYLEDKSSFYHAASGLYFRYLSKDFVTLSNEVYAYTTSWVKATPVSRYVNDFEPLAAFGIMTRTPVVSQKELLDSIELKKQGRVTIGEPQWGIASELYLGERFLSDSVPSGILDVSYQRQMQEFSEGEGIESTLRWYPNYSGEYVQSVSTLLPPSIKLRMVGYREVKVIPNNSETILPCLWGNYRTNDSIMDILE